MFDTFHCFYYPILLCASILAYLSYKNGNHKYGFLLILFVVTIFFELLTSFLSTRNDRNHKYIFIMFNAFEYSILAVYYRRTSHSDLMRKLVKYSAILFVLNSLIFSGFVAYSYKVYG